MSQVLALLWIFNLRAATVISLCFSICWGTVLGLHWWPGDEWAQIMVFASKTGTFLSGKVVFLCISRSHGMDFGLPDGSRFWHRHPPYENTSSRQVVQGCQTKLGTSFFRGASFFWCSFLGSGYEAARTAGAFSTIFFDGGNNAKMVLSL